MVQNMRIEALEGRTEAMLDRLERVERRLGVEAAAPIAPPVRVPVRPERSSFIAPVPRRRPSAVYDRAPVAPESVSVPVAPSPSAALDPIARDERKPLFAPRPSNTSLEDLLGGRVLAWVGGLAVLVGVLLLFALAVSQGWIGLGTRTLLAGAGSLALLAFGVRLHEHGGRTDAALAAASTGIAALFATITVASRVYDLIGVEAAFPLALVVGALATVLAIRWDAQGVGALGIVGALAAPVLVGAPSDAATLVLLFVAGLSAVGVLLWRRWLWLSFAVFALVTPQWLAWMFDGPSTAGSVGVLVLFGALNIGAAIGWELRRPQHGLRAGSTYLFALNAIVLATAGAFVLPGAGHENAGKLWLAALALVYIAMGLIALRGRRISHEVGLLSLVIGVVLADVAFGVTVHGPAVAAGWAASAVFFARLRSVVAKNRQDENLAAVGLGVHVVLSLLRALFSDAPPSMLGGGGEAADMTLAVLAVSSVAAGCFVSARLADEGRPELRLVLDGLGLAALAYLTAIVLDGPGLAVAWALESMALSQLARRSDDRVATVAAVAFAGGVLAHALAVEAPPAALVSGLRDPLAAAGVLIALAAAAWRLRSVPLIDSRWPDVMTAAAGLSLLYLASTAIVTPFQPGADVSSGALLELGVREQGQVLLSALWAVVGVVVLVVGLRRDLRSLRLAALGLLLATVAKVFLFDLATLTSVYRVASFIGLGLLLLVGAFAWQRMRPRPLEDLRQVPDGVR